MRGPRDRRVRLGSSRRRNWIARANDPFNPDGTARTALGDTGQDDHERLREVVDGDFAMLESELQGVLKALRGAGINIVAIHQHMTGENPRVLFLHFWGLGSTESLAKGIKAALDTQNK